MSSTVAAATAAFTTIELVREERTAWIRFTRPEQLNSLTEQVLDDLDAALDAVEADREVRALVITGQGKAFCVGLDLGLLSRAFADPSYFESVLSRLGALCERLESLPVVTMAAVGGLARAGGFELMLACDLVVLAEEARIGDVHTVHGVAPGRRVYRAPAPCRRRPAGARDLPDRPVDRSRGGGRPSVSRSRPSRLAELDDADACCWPPGWSTSPATASARSSASSSRSTACPTHEGVARRAARVPRLCRPRRLRRPGGLPRLGGAEGALVALTCPRCHWSRTPETTQLRSTVRCDRRVLRPRLLRPDRARGRQPHGAVGRARQGRPARRRLRRGVRRRRRWHGRACPDRRGARLRRASADAARALAGGVRHDPRPVRQPTSSGPLGSRRWPPARRWSPSRSPSPTPGRTRTGSAPAPGATATSG